MSEAIAPSSVSGPFLSNGERWADRPFWFTSAVIAAYFVVVLLLFVYWVNPSLTGINDRHITADSQRYLFFADSLRSGDLNPYVIAALYSFPNTSWGPVLLALLFPDNFSMVLVNLAIFCLCLWLCSRAVQADVLLFFLLLVLNPTTTISLLAVNKELLDFLTLSLFLYYLRHGRRVLLLLALLISLVSRYETCITMTLFLYLRSRWNPLRKRRSLSLLAYCLLLNFLIAGILATPSQAYRLAEAEGTSAYSGGTFMLLNSLEQHFLFVVAVVPKILENLFAEVFNVSHWFAFSAEDPANTSIVFGNNLANLLVVVLLAARRQLTLRSSLIYYAALIAVTVSISVVIQPRYFYAMYGLLCLEYARRHPVPQDQHAGRNLYAIA